MNFIEQSFLYDQVQSHEIPDLSENICFDRYCWIVYNLQVPWFHSVSAAFLPGDSLLKLLLPFRKTPRVPIRSWRKTFHLDGHTAVCILLFMFASMAWKTQQGEQMQKSPPVYHALIGWGLHGRVLTGSGIHRIRRPGSFSRASTWWPTVPWIGPSIGMWHMAKKKRTPEATRSPQVASRGAVRTEEGVGVPLSHPLTSD